MQNPAGASGLNAWIQPNEPGTDVYDWPSFEYEKKDGKDVLKYFDFTGRYLVKPDEYYDEDYGEAIPLCYFMDGYRYDCTSQEIHVRTSIAKIDANKTRDYEPLEYGNELMTKFGYFRTERLTYNRKYGVTELGRILPAHRYNVWTETCKNE